MPYSKSTQKDYGDNPLQKRSGFKMKGYSYPGTSPVTDKGEHKHPHKKPLTDAEKLANLRKHKEEIESLKPEQRKEFTKVWKKYGGKTKQLKQNTSA